MRGIPGDLISMVVKDALKCIIQRTWQDREHNEHDYYSLKFVALIIITQGDDWVQTTCREEQIKTLFFVEVLHIANLDYLSLFIPMHVQLNLVLG